jgi:hypothetical protein
VRWDGAPAGSYYTFTNATTNQTTYSMVVANAGGNTYPINGPGGSPIGIPVNLTGTKVLGQIKLGSGAGAWIVNPINMADRRETWNFSKTAAPTEPVSFRSQRAGVLGPVLNLNLPVKTGPALYVGPFPIQSIALPTAAIMPGGAPALNAAILAESVGLGWLRPDGSWVAAVDGNYMYRVSIDPAGSLSNKFTGADPNSQNPAAGALTSRQVNLSLDGYIGTVFGPAFNSLNLTPTQWAQVDGAWGAAPDLTVDPTGDTYRFWAVVDYDAQFAPLAPVPEPATVSLLCIGGTLLLRRRSRHR